MVPLYFWEAQVQNACMLTMRGWVLVGAVICVVLCGLWWVTGGAVPGQTTPPQESASAAAALPEDEGTTSTTTGSLASTTDSGAGASSNSDKAVAARARVVPQDVAAVAEHIDGASRFAELLSSTGVGPLIRGKGPYTIFVPTDGAFSLVRPGTITGMTAAQKKRLVEYHVVVGRAIDPDAVKSGSITALSKDPLNIWVGNDLTPRVDSAIIIDEYKATNGIVYLISGVLIPPKRGSI